MHAPIFRGTRHLSTMHDRCQTTARTAPRPAPVVADGLPPTGTGKVGGVQAAARFVQAEVRAYWTGDGASKPSLRSLSRREGLQSGVRVWAKSTILTLVLLNFRDLCHSCPRENALEFLS